MKFPTFLFAILVFVTSFVGQTVSLPVADGALEVRLENGVDAPVLISEVNSAVNTGDSISAATKEGDNKPHAKNGHKKHKKKKAKNEKKKGKDEKKKGKDEKKKGKDEKKKKNGKNHKKAGGKKDVAKGGGMKKADSDAD